MHKRTRAKQPGETRNEEQLRSAAQSKKETQISPYGRDFSFRLRCEGVHFFVMQQQKQKQQQFQFPMPVAFPLAITICSTWPIWPL